MKESCCGFNCEDCPLFIATKYNDESIKEEVIKQYQIVDKCMGCLSDTNISFCKECNIRKCCLEQSIKNCGRCKKYPNCSTIEVVINTNVKSKEFLDSQNTIDKHHE